MVGIGVNLANDKLHQRGYAISFDIDSCPRRTRSLWDLRAIVLTAPGKYCVAEAAQIHSQMEEIVMSVHFDATRAPTVFALPEESHAELVKLCGHLRLMAQLTAAGGNASMPDQRLGPDAMAWCFSQLAKEVESIIEAAWYSAELVNSYETARKS